MTASHSSGPVFIVSTGRTGTTFLSQVLTDLGVDAPHEPGPRSLRRVSNAFVSGHLTLEHAMSRVVDDRPSSLWEDHAYVEPSCLVYGLVAPILEAIPMARVVHVVRDPRTYIRSAMDWGVHRPAGRPLNLLRYRRLAPTHFDGRLASRVTWARTGQFHRLCWTWTAMNRSMRQQGEGHERFTTMRFEDLFSRNSSALEDLLAFAGLNDVADDVRDRVSHPINTTSGRFPPWQEWTEEQLGLLLTHCEEEAARYGYELQKEVAAHRDREAT